MRYCAWMVALVALSGCVEDGGSMSAVAPEPPVIATLERNLSPAQQALADITAPEAAELVAEAYRESGCVVTLEDREFVPRVQALFLDYAGLGDREGIMSEVYFDFGQAWQRGEDLLIEQGRLVIDDTNVDRFDCGG